MGENGKSENQVELCCVVSIYVSRLVKIDPQIMASDKGQVIFLVRFTGEVGEI